MGKYAVCMFIFCLSHSEAYALFVRGGILWTIIVSQFMGAILILFLPFLFREGLPFQVQLENAHFHRQGRMLGFLVMTRTATGNNIDIKNVHSVM